MVKIIVFDMDDTLYEEISFVHSGFLAIDEFMHKKYNIAKNTSAELCREILEQQGRGEVFDTMLKTLGFYTKTLLNECIKIYRHHEPKISISPDTASCLEYLKSKGYRLYTVTDGHKFVQANKAKALGLKKWMEHVFVTHRYGLKHAKPSVYCFEKICEIEDVKPNEVVYIGDNPNKDFIGIKPLGFKTIRIKQGMFENIEKDDIYEADFRINSLNEVFEAIKKINHGVQKFQKRE
jgi:putative hydrolase of the HAD superfamily